MKKMELERNLVERKESDKKSSFTIVISQKVKEELQSYTKKNGLLSSFLIEKLIVEFLNAKK